MVGRKLPGSFLEDIETSENRAPNDLDLVTVYWGYDLSFQERLRNSFPEFASPYLSRQNYSLDHYPFDAGHHPTFTVEQSRYWILLFSHNRLGVWKGMVRLEIDTPDEDRRARAELAKGNT
jgi:hypothetical protein